MNFSAVKHTLDDLKDLLHQLSHREYSLPIVFLGNSSIGEHTRHIVELFQCLLVSYECGRLNYDERNRDKQLETDTNFAMQSIDRIIDSIEKNNKDIVLEQCVLENKLVIATNYFREVVYNLEHCIHHQALIKVAIYQMENIKVKENFGIAPSTLEYRKQCAQ